MSVEAVSWALGVPVGGNQKVVLLGLANHAHPDGTAAFPALDTLAKYAHCDRSTARRNRDKLEASGWITRDGVGPNGQVKYRLAMGEPFTRGDGEMPPAQDATDGTSVSPGVAPAPPEPSMEPSEGGEEARPREDFPPAGFPEALKPHLRAALVVLRDLARRHGARKVTALSLGHVIAARRHKPIVKAAHDYAAWADAKAERRKDVAAGYRNWLDRCDDLAAIERLPDAGPARAAAAGPAPRRSGALRAYVALRAEQQAARGAA